MAGARPFSNAALKSILLPSGCGAEHTMGMPAPTPSIEDSGRLHRLFDGTRYLARALELLADNECTVEGSRAGLLVHRPVAGAADDIKVELLIGSVAGRVPHARVVIAELPDDGP